MTNDLDALCARASQLLQGVTPGPWEMTYKPSRGVGNFCLRETGPLSFGWDGEEGIYADNSADIDFIAASRELVPELLSALTKCREELASKERG